MLICIRSMISSYALMKAYDNDVMKRVSTCVKVHETNCEITRSIHIHDMYWCRNTSILHGDIMSANKCKF